MELITDVLSQDPINPEAILIRARILEKQELFEEAIKEFERAIETEECKAEGFFYLA
jgi:Tfp pilus assembly protein PilF